MAQTGLALNFSSHSSSDRARAACTAEFAYDAAMAKRSEKPKKSQKQQPQKSLKERRAEKRAAKKFGSADRG